MCACLCVSVLGADEGLRCRAVGLGQSVQIQTSPGLLGGRLHQLLLLVDGTQRAGL